MTIYCAKETHLIRRGEFFSTGLTRLDARLHGWLHFSLPYSYAKTARMTEILRTINTHTGGRGNIALTYVNIYVMLLYLIAFTSFKYGYIQMFYTQIRFKNVMNSAAPLVPSHCVYRAGVP